MSNLKHLSRVQLLFAKRDCSRYMDTLKSTLSGQQERMRWIDKYLHKTGEAKMITKIWIVASRKVRNVVEGENPLFTYEKSFLNEDDAMEATAKQIKQDDPAVMSVGWYSRPDGSFVASAGNMNWTVAATLVQVPEDQVLVLRGSS